MSHFSLDWKRYTRTTAAVLAACALLLPHAASALDKVRVGVFPVSSSLPLFVAIAFMLISDIDAPRTGMIQVPPLNLEALAHSLKDQR